MSQLQQVNRMRSGVAAYVEAIAVPDYDLPAVQARLNQSVAPRGRLRWAAAALAAAVIVVGFVFASPMVVAQVERMLQAFAANGLRLRRCGREPRERHGMGEHAHYHRAHLFSNVPLGNCSAATAPYDMRMFCIMPVSS
jgi:hypothetical protein